MIWFKPVQLAITTRRASEFPKWVEKTSIEPPVSVTLQEMVKITEEAHKRLKKHRCLLIPEIVRIVCD
jgi:hypothetical protein